MRVGGVVPKFYKITLFSGHIWPLLVKNFVQIYFFCPISHFSSPKSMGWVVCPQVWDFCPNITGGLPLAALCSVEVEWLLMWCSHLIVEQVFEMFLYSYCVQSYVVLLRCFPTTASFLIGQWVLMKLNTCNACFQWMLESMLWRHIYIRLYIMFVGKLDFPCDPLQIVRWAPFYSWVWRGIMI